MSTKRHERTFWDDGNALYLDHSDCYMCVYTCQNPVNFTLKISVGEERILEI